MIELPAGKLVPDKWNENKSAITALYKHTSRSGKQFSLSVRFILPYYDLLII